MRSSKCSDPLQALCVSEAVRRCSIWAARRIGQKCPGLELMVLASVCKPTHGTAVQL